MTILIPIATSVVSAMLVFILQSVIKENRTLKQEQTENSSKREKAKEDGIVCLLRVRLIEYHAEYTEKGSISNISAEAKIQVLENKITVLEKALDDALKNK